MLNTIYVTNLTKVTRCIKGWKKDRAHGITKSHLNADRVETKVKVKFSCEKLTFNVPRLACTRSTHVRWREVDSSDM